MKTLKRTLLFIAVIVIILFIILSALLRQVSVRALPDYNKDVNLVGLYEEVQVYRDSMGIPHIYASNEHDLYLATGYLMAQDRLWQMDLLRRVTLGRLSEIFGNKYFTTDCLMRALNFSKKSQQIIDSSDNFLIASLDAFSDGVNQYIEQHQRKLPPEFTILRYKPEKWNATHSLNLISYMAWDLKAGWSQYAMEEFREQLDTALYRELIPDVESRNSVVFQDYGIAVNNPELMKLLTAENLLEDLGLDVFSASNNWAVTGEKSATGKPLLANDMHLGFNIPGIWYQIHQCIPGKLNVAGLALPGSPLIIAGHNDSIAWGMTNTYVDNLDLYLEKVNPDDSTKYLYNNEWKDFRYETVTIKSKKGADKTCTLRYTHRGPVVSEFKGVGDKVISMRWIGDVYSNEYRTIYLLNRAGNWDDFKNAFHSFISISQNVAYADVNGNIGLYCCAGVPIRKRQQGLFLLPGITDEYDWKGIIPFEELPHTYKPTSNQVSSANNKTTENNYPYHIGTWYSLPYRIDRIRELLNSKNKLDIEDFKRIQKDTKSKLAEELLKQIIPVLEKSKILSKNEVQYLDTLKNWDCVLSKKSVAAYLFDLYYLDLVKNIFQDQLGEVLYSNFLAVSQIPRVALYNVLKNDSSEWWDDVHTKDIIETRDEILTQTFVTVTSKLKSEVNSEQVIFWGNKHQLTLTHPLGIVKFLNLLFDFNRGPFSVGGSFHTVSPYGYEFSNPFAVNHGASHRSIYDLSNWDNSISVIPTGNSGIPKSPYYCNQTRLYINYKYHNDFFSMDKVEANAYKKMKFIPVKRR